MDGDGQHPPALIETLVGALARWRLRRRLHRQGASRERAAAAPLRRAGVLLADQLGRAAEDPGGRRRLPAAVAARGRRRCGRCRSATASSRAWRAGSAFASSASTTSRRARDHGTTTWNVWTLIGLSIEGLTSFSVAPLRLASLLGLLLAAQRAVLRRLDPVGDAVLRQGRARLSVARCRPDGARRRAALMIGVLGEYIGKILSEIKARPVYFVAEHSVKRERDERRAQDAEVDAPAPPPNDTCGDGEQPRRIWLCADDYGIAPGVNARHPRAHRARPAQRHLGDGRRRRASTRAEARRWRAQRRRARARDRPARDADRAVQAAERRFRAAARWRLSCRSRSRCGAAMLRRLERERFATEIAAQLEAFVARIRPRRPTSSTAISMCICCRRCATPSSPSSRDRRRTPGCGNAAARRARDRFTTARPWCSMCSAALPPQGSAPRHRHQSGLCRRL